MTEPEEAHFTATFPSDTIAEVMEAYFNKSVFRQKVRVVDLRMQADMCMFSLAWVSQNTPETPPTTLPIPSRMNGTVVKRDPKGRFVPVIPHGEES